MRKLVLVTLVMLLVTTKAAAQDPKPWTEWSKTEAEKMLNDSPWGQTQVYKQTSSSSRSSLPGRSTSTVATGSLGPAGTIASPNSNDGAAMKSVLMGGTPRLPTTSSSSFTVNYTFRIRFLSAKPIREAFAAMFLIKQAGTNSADREKAAESLKSFVERESANYIVVAVESVDIIDLPQDLSAPLKDNTYLQRRDGKRVLLINYRAPGPDGLGAQFLFPRSLEDQPFLNLDSGEVRFHSEIAPGFKLERLFRLSNMVYRGKLEY